MSKTKARLDRLEGMRGTDSNIILAHIPAHWDRQQSEDGISRLIAQHGLSTEWQRDLTRDPNASEARLTFAGNLEKAILDVAANSRRIGD